MPARFVSIWFRHLVTDWMAIRDPALRDKAFVLVSLQHGRKMITQVSVAAAKAGVEPEMVLADARAVLPELQYFDEDKQLPLSILLKIATWCIRFTPSVAVDAPSGILLDASGCAHLWGGEQPYLADIVTRLGRFGYAVSAGMADTTGAAWAMARYSRDSPICPSGGHLDALMKMPPQAIRLGQDVTEKMSKFGLYTVAQLIGMPRKALRRRFGDEVPIRIDQATGTIVEPLTFVCPPARYQERLPCLEPIVTATGIGIALEKLLEALCRRLQQEGKGLRTAIFRGYRADGKIEQIQIGTNHASHSAAHLYQLFALKIQTIEPAMGIELFVLEGQGVETAASDQQAFWAPTGNLLDVQVAQLLDRIAGRIGAENIHRYVPEENYWPELSCKQAASLGQQPGSEWRPDRRPLNLLLHPAPVEVSVPIPDYPPMLFVLNGQVHHIQQADGPERIGRAWWLHKGQHRDYYSVEDKAGQRYWLFRSGGYRPGEPQRWFLHGIFA